MGFVILLAVFTPGVAADCVPSSSGLVGWWSGDGNAGNIAGTNNGTLQGGATASAAGLVSSAFSFDGTNGFVQIADSAALRPTNFTIECWVRFTSLDSAGLGGSPAGDQYIVFKQNSRNSAFEGFDLDKTRTGNGDVFRLIVSSSAGVSTFIQSSTLISTGVWYHVAASRGSNFLQLYVNGVLERQTNVAFAQDYGTLPLYFGTTGQPFWDHKLNGFLDEVSLYNRALSSNEISSIYAAGASGKCKAVIIAVQPQGQSVNIGSNAAFAASATGYGTLSYQWQLNTTNIAGATNASMIVGNVQNTNAGSYRVVVTNALSSATSSVAVLTVNVLPFISTGPTNQTVVSGANVSFNVSAGGTAPLNYQWRKGGGALAGKTNSALSLAGVTTNDAGNYDVVVSNVAGSVTSAPAAVLTVNVVPFVTAGPTNQTVVSGGNVNFSVGAGGTAPLNYQWRKNGGALAGKTNTTLSLTGVTTNDAGNYDVVVSNVAGSVTSTPPAELTVSTPTNVPPFVVSLPQSASALVGANVSFAVVAGGTQPLSYQWRRNGLSLSGKVAASIQLSGVTTNDAGSYDVVISNAVGSVTSAPPADLAVVPTVNVPSFVTVPPLSQTAGLGTDVILTVVAGGTSPLNYQWRKDGASLPGQGGAGLFLSGVTTNDSGLYDVVVSNVAGSVTSAVASVVVRVVVDPQLEAAVRCAVGNLSGTLSVQDLQTLTNLSVRNRGVTNLMGLQFATNLAALDSSQNAIGSLTPLQGLTQLRSLELDRNRGSITTIAPLSGLTNLTRLVLGGVYVGNHSPLTNLTGLVALGLRDCGVVGLNSFDRLTKLSYLDLSQNGITNISGLAGLTNLDYLDLRWNRLTNLNSQWTGPTNLASLYLGGNYLSNAPTLQALPRLTLLNLDGNGLKNLSPLAGLTNLTYLSLSRNPITNYSVLSGLANLTSLELSGNNIWDASFLTSLAKLNYGDFSFNRITNLAPFSGLTNLTSLVLAGNPQLTYGALSTMPNIQNLWLHNNSISNASFLAGLPWLKHLNLDDNQIANMSPMLSITNLTGLGLSRNPVTNIAALASSSNLASLSLDGDLIGDLGFIQVLKSLSFLSATRNQVTNISSLSGLTNLQSVFLDRNRIVDIQPLSNLGKLAFADVSLNLMQFTNASSNSELIGNLQCQNSGVDVTFLPQRQHPRIEAPGRLFMATNTSSSLEFSVFDNISPADPLPVSGSSSSTALIANTNLIFTGTNTLRSLHITPSLNQSGNSTLTLTVMNEAGLKSSATVEISVLVPIGVTNNMLPPGITNLDPMFEVAIRQASGKLSGELTSVDLLKVTTLNAVGANLVNFAGWQWLTNLTTLDLSGIALTNVSFLTNLPQLTALSLRDTSVTDFQPVASLTNLAVLHLTGTTITNVVFVSSLSKLTALTLTGTLVADIAPLAGLTNLNFLDLHRNRLLNIQTLYNLPRLTYVDLRNNLLDTSGGSASTAVIQYLTTRAIAVNLQPQRKPPALKIGNNWNVGGNRSSWLYFQVLEDGQITFEPVTIGVTSSNSSLLPTSGLVVGQDINMEDWFVSVTPLTNQTGTATIFIAATNDVGFTTSTTLVVTVSSPFTLNQQFLGTPNLSWQTSGNAPWFGQTNISPGGFPSAQSGSIGNFGVSSLEASVVGPGTLSFWWKVSSETNFDWLIFESPATSNQISGQVDWQQKIVQLGPELQTIKWHYRKDQNIVGGLDAGWISQVSFVPSAWLKTQAGLGAGQFQMLLYGTAGQNYEIQVSSNLVHWSVLTNITSTNSIMPFVDLTPLVERRFYRVRVSAVPSASLKVPAGLGAGQFQMLLYGTAGQNYEIQVSSNLVHWSVLTNITSTNSIMPFVDLTPVLERRFYRARAIP